MMCEEHYFDNLATCRIEFFFNGIGLSSIVLVGILNNLGMALVLIFGGHHFRCMQHCKATIVYTSCNDLALLCVAWVLWAPEHWRLQLGYNQ